MKSHVFFVLGIVFSLIGISYIAHANQVKISPVCGVWPNGQATVPGFTPFFFSVDINCADTSRSTATFYSPTLKESMTRSLVQEALTNSSVMITTGHEKATVVLWLSLSSGSDGKLVLSGDGSIRTSTGGKNSISVRMTH